MPLLDPAAVQTRLQALPGWELEAGPPPCIARTFGFPAYADGVAFAVKVALLAERTNHHPDLEVLYRRVRVRYSSHDAGGVTERDLVAALNVTEL